MKVIITYASAGAGHRKAAEALFGYFKDCCPQAEVSLVDVLEKTSKFFKFSYTRGYDFLIRRAIFLWHFAFWLTSLKSLSKFTRGVALVTNKSNAKRFSEFLIQENPDYIISTHFFPSEVAGYLKTKNKIKSKVITVITDFGVHPFWISPGTDLYIVAAEYTKGKLISLGVDAKRVKKCGIPVASKFLQLRRREELAVALGLKPDKFTVLIMTGSFGIGPLAEIAKLFHQEVQILVVCANNLKLYERLQKSNLPGVLVFGFIDNSEELMAVSDIIITKPGGLSIAEILAIELIPIFISAIPGQEIENIKALREIGIGFAPSSLREIKKLVLDLKLHPEKISAMKENMRKIHRPDCLGEICHAIC